MSRKPAFGSKRRSEGLPVPPDIRSTPKALASDSRPRPSSARLLHSPPGRAALVGVTATIKYPKIAPDRCPDSRRGKGRIVVLRNPWRNAEAGQIDKQEGTRIVAATLRVQVLNEFASVASRKLGMSWAEIREVLGSICAVCRVEPISLETHDRGIALSERYGFSIYDSISTIR